MDSEGQWVNTLSSDLFWDVEQATVDVVKNRRWLVERILTRGRLEDLLLLVNNLGHPALRELLPFLKVPGREKHFLEWILESHHA